MSAPARHSIGLTRSIVLAALAVSAIAPLLVLVGRASVGEWFWPVLLPSTLSLAAWRTLLVPGGGVLVALGTSIVLATACGVVACAVGFPVGRALGALRGRSRHLGAALVFLPVAVPPVALGVGAQLVAIRLGVAGTMAGVLAAHLIPAVGYLSLYFLGVFTTYDARVEEASRTLGANAVTTFMRVTIPLLRRPIAEAVALGFLVSWAQVPLTLLVGGGAVRTLPLELLAYVDAGQDQFAAAAAIVLTLPALAAMSLFVLAARRTSVVAV